MELSGHLLYIDITQICGIGCSFCMYADRHSLGAQLELSEQGRHNLARLINHPSVKRVSISGEGEPLNNVAAFHAILGLSRGGVAFEFITSGFLPHDRLNRFYDKTEAILQAHGDTCNIRLSSDSYHVEKIRHRPHGASLRRALAAAQGALSFSFRSVDTDRAFTRGYLLREAADCPGKPRIVEAGPLADQLVVGDRTFAIDYKNHVHPGAEVATERLDLHAYIAAIEARTGKRFTLGSLNPAPLHNGLDVTVKPDGAVALYGIEYLALGNIHADSFSWEALAGRVAGDPLLHRLHTTPFLDAIARIDDQDAVRALASTVNNPYWLVKEIAKHPGMMQQLAAK
ncbi:radical SAM protein [Ideonella sp. B508-1]|uniref:radical SAM protein n=1 Tax=Ideonella sp. B508-1 TaxID=137716 RepID=UPI000344BE74|nr:radical SAM protein [Ideonella sp. B508-1]